MNLILLIAAVAAPATPATTSPDTDADTILVTGAREPEPEADAPVSATEFDRDVIRSLALPLAQDVLRLSPGISVAETGPKGTQTQIRIRGAEANHTLLFVDGIRFNDPAAGNEARFELLTSDSLSRIEVVRGPQSALWGSEALGGVIAVESRDASQGRGADATAEYGSLDSARASGSFAAQAGSIALSGSAGWLSSGGIDSFAHGGERDGFDNGSASLKAVIHPGASSQIGVVGHWVEGRSEFDGTDPVTFRRADTTDETHNRIGAVRGWGSIDSDGWKLSADASWLGSTNRNSLDDAPLNRTSGDRFTAGGQVSKSLGGQRLTAAIEHDDEHFHARDSVYGGATDQDRSRHSTGLVGEWSADWSRFLTTDIALRRDSFSAFADATTFRGAAILKPGKGWRLHLAYGEGIAQPSFYDLYGFFPGSFQGNPALKPERSRGWEAGVNWQHKAVALGVAGYSNRLHDEIVDTFDSTTFRSSTANASGTSRRRGIELDASYRPSPAFWLAANYSYLDANEQTVAGSVAVKEVRRPHNTANLLAGGEAGRFSWSASLAYIGKRLDTDFDPFPSVRVRLNDYLLGSARVGWKLTDRLEAYVRTENAFDARYQDVVGYRTAGRMVYAGLRLRLGA